MWIRISSEALLRYRGSSDGGITPHFISCFSPILPPFSAILFIIWSLKNNSRNVIKKLVSDGVLVSTPAGSTAYNLSVHGPILNLNSKRISIAPISAFRPRRWAGKIVSDKSKVTIKNLDPKKRPVSAVADNFEVRHAKQITIKKNKKIQFSLMYDKNRSLQKKISIEKLRKEL